jgi:hypothetical protein
MDLFFLTLFLIVFLRLIALVLTRQIRRKTESRFPRTVFPPGYDFKAGGRWISKDETVLLHGHFLQGGMFYLGSRLKGYDGINDASLINPFLPLKDVEGEKDESSSINNEEGEIRYANLSPEKRLEFIKWLSEGRKSGEGTSLCFPKLFFYGLERRLILDGIREVLNEDERQSIVHALLDLKDEYGEDKAFKNMVKTLLALEWAIYGRYDQAPGYLDFTCIYSSEAFVALLASLSRRGLPIPSDVALNWVVLRERLNAPGEERRKRDEFEDLFKVRYTEKYGAGMILHPSKKTLRVSYDPANPSLGGKQKIRVKGLPDPFLISTPVHIIDRLATDCEVELYGRPDEDGASPAVE